MDFTALLTLLCVFPWFSEPLPEASHLPGPNAVADSLALGEAHREWVHRQYMTPPWPVPMDDFWRPWLRECEECLAPWKLLQAAQCPWVEVEARKANLVLLRGMLGESRWWRGQLGAPVPLDRFGDAPPKALPAPQGVVAGK